MTRTPDRLRVLWVSTAFYPEVRLGGNVTQAWEECRALVRAGVSVTVHTTQLGAPGSASHRDDDGVAVRYFPRTVGYWRAFSLALAFDSLRAPGRFDLLHINSPWQLPSPFAVVGARMAQRPYVISLRGTLMPWSFAQHPWRKRPYFELVERRIIGGAASILAANEREEAIARERWPNAHIETVLPIVDVQRFGTPAARSARSAYGIAADAPLALFVGRNHPVKGLDLLLSAMRDVIGSVPTARLLIAGPEHRGTDADLVRLVTELGLGDAVVLAGMISEEEKVAAYQAADVVVMPSRQEGFGQVAAEAMASGTPVIVTSEMGIAPIVRDAQAGVVVAVDAAAIAEAIVRVLSSVTERRAIGERAARAAAERFAAPVVAEHMLRIYERAIARG